MSNINGLTSYYKKNGSNKLIAVHNQNSNNSDLMYATESAGIWSNWEMITNGGSLPTDARVEFENFIDYCFIVGATTGASPTFITTSKINDIAYYTSGTDLTGAAKARYIKKWRDLLWLGNIEVDSIHYPNRIFYSDAVTSGVITWTSTNWIDIDVDDGDEIMGLGVTSDRLIVLKEFSLYRYDQNSMIKVADIGTTAQRSVKNLRGYTFWFNREGIYRYDGEFPVLISGPMKPYIDGMTSSPYNVCAEVDDDNYRLFIGTTVVDEETHNNVWLNYSLSLDSWSHDKTADTILCTTNYVDSNNNKRIYFGTDQSIVYKKADRSDAIYSDQYVDSSTTGVPIQVEVETGNINCGAPEAEKYFKRVSLLFDKVQGVNIFYSIDNTQFKPISSINSPIIRKDFSATAVHFINFKLTENSKNPPFVFNGFVIEADLESC